MEIRLQKLKSLRPRDLGAHSCKAAYASLGVDFDRSVQKRPDGSKIETCQAVCLDGSKSIRTEHVQKPDGSRTHSSVEETPDKIRESIYRESPHGVVEHVVRCRQKLGPDFSESSKIVYGDGSSTERVRSFFNYGHLDSVRRLWERCPESLRESLGENPNYGRLKLSVSTINSQGHKTTESRETVRWTSTDGRRTLDVTPGSDALPDRFTLSNRRGLSMSSQTFLWGSADTWSERRDVQEGFQVTRTTEDFRDVARLCQKKARTAVPSAGSTIIRKKDESTLKDLYRLADSCSQLKTVFRSERFIAFRETLRGNSFSLVVRESEQTFTDGKRRSGTQLVAQAKDGSQLIFLEGTDQGAAVQFFPQTVAPRSTLLERWGGALPVRLVLFRRLGGSLS